MRSLITPALLLVCLAVPGRADADPAPGPSQKARALFREGNRLVRRKDYPAALERFRAAYALYPSPKILLNTGTTLQLLGRNAEAADAYEHYLADPGADPTRRAEVTGLVEALDRQVARLHVTVDVDRAEVLIDGTRVGDAAPRLDRRIEPGKHTIAGHADSGDASVEVVAVAGEELPVRLALAAVVTRPDPVVPAEPVAPAQPPPDRARPPKPPGLVPPPVKPPPPTVHFDDEGGARRWRPPAWAPWASAGVAAVSAGLGAYFGLHARDADVGYDDARSAARDANLSFGVAVVAALGAGGLWWWRH